ncbi:hypothetical protein CDD83_9827 [Cordyceps sp. RAO-2017]|nr:hypothetical protein CDD83_9827 [Cordyceps sp. RAO-2017]
MMSHGHGPLLSLIVGAWCCCLWLCLVPLAGTSVARAAPVDRAPRAVLVSLTHEHDLYPMLSSISQLEDTFNGRYRYDWVFFSTGSLSEEFRRLTSNATKATCIYEVIRHGSWSAPAGTPDLEPQWPGTEHHDDDRLGQMRRWKSGPFARESRLRDYDWFWIIEPGAQFTHDIDFDVFRVMRDYGIAYGSNKASPSRLPQQVKRFIDDTPGLVNAEADFSWLPESADESRDGSDRVALAHVKRGEDDEAGWREGRDGTADVTAADGWLDDGREEDDADSPMGAFASRLGSSYRPA